MGLTLTEAALAATGIGVVIAGGIGLYYLFAELFANDEYNKKFNADMDRLINTWRNEAVYVFCTVAGDRHGPKWWKANVTSVNINDTGIGSWDVEGQINAGIEFQCNIADSTCIMKMRDGPPLGAREVMYAYDFETQYVDIKPQDRHYDVMDNIIRPFPSSQKFTWKVRFHRHGYISTSGEHTVEFLHPILRMVVDFDYRTFHFYAPHNTKRTNASGFR